MFEVQFPPFLSFAWCDEPGIDESPLSSSESAQLAAFKSEKRRVDFLLGRISAKKALLKLEVNKPLLQDENGLPLWPEGVCGSISHSHEFGVALVGLKRDVSSIGIDLERIRKTRDISQRICTDSEKKWLSQQEGERELLLLRIFSAKEAVYKALYPLFSRPLAFRDVELRWDDTAALFWGSVKGEPAVNPLQISSCLTPPYVLSYLYLPPA